MSNKNTRRNVALESGVRPKQPQTARPLKKLKDRRAPKSVRDVDRAMTRLEPAEAVRFSSEGVANWDERRRLLALRTDLGRRTDNDATRLRGTVEVAVEDPDDTRKARRNLTRVRQSEAWRHNKLSGMQRDAEKEMEFAWRQRTAGLGAAVSRYGQQRGRSSRADLGTSLDEAWLKWAALAVPRRVMVDVVIDCIAEPKTLAQVERDHRMRRGQAFDNYVLGLDLWCEVRGWVRGPSMRRGPHLLPESPTDRGG